jgi:ADP-heptose:LPS heptosyltransferase
VVANLAPTAAPSAIRRTPRIAVLVPGDGLGDGIMRIPLLHAIRRRWPGHRVWWIAAGATALRTALNRYVINDLERIEIGFNVEACRSQVLAKARDLPHFDVVFNFYSRIGSVLAAKSALRAQEHFACLPFQIASSRRDPSWIVKRPAQKVRRVLSMAAAAGLNLRPARESFPVTAEAEALAKRLVPPGVQAIGLAIGRGNLAVDKEWPLERTIALGNRISARGYRPVFLIGPAERPYVAAVRSGVPRATMAELDRVCPDTGAGGVDLCLAVGQRLAAAVTIDAGLAHVLAVCDVPQVVLFGPTNPRRWAPDVEPIEIVRAQDFGAVSMDAISVQSVEQALIQLMARVEGNFGLAS